LTPTEAASSKLKRPGLRRRLAAGTAISSAWVSVAGDANVAARAPDLSSNPFGRTCLDHPGEIAAGDARQRRLFHRSGDILDVARVDRSRHDPHQSRPLV